MSHARSVARRLDEVAAAAVEVPIDDASRVIVFSDIHRGDNSWADDFAHNQTLFFFALGHYHERGFTYIELGDELGLCQDPARAQ